LSERTVDKMGLFKFQMRFNLSVYYVVF